MKRAGFYIKYLLAFFVLLAADLFTKQLAVRELMNREDVVIVRGTLVLRYLENRGAAFGILQNARWFFLVTGLIFIAAAALFFKKVPMERRYRLLRICVLLILSGAVGNFIDRAAAGYVVDFIYFSLINFPIFNVADCYVTIGTFLLFIAVMFVYKDEELKFFGAGPEGAGKPEVQEAPKSPETAAADVDTPAVADGDISAGGARDVERVD